MSPLSRRTILTRGALLGGATLVAPAARQGAAGGHPDPSAEPAPEVLRGDPRHASLSRGQNQRWVSNPERIALPRSTRQVVDAVQAAVADGKRLAVRSGGHCYEGFVDHPGTQVIIDMSGMAAIEYDHRHNAVMVEVGATLGEVYGALYKRWGVTLPGGSCHPVGVGGHVAGAGYGQLSRRHGVIVDHLHAVEVVVVDGHGRARAVVATRDAHDPNRDLWWAHTGGGGGSFGVVTRYWFRSPDAVGGDPARLLPAPPAAMWTHRVQWPWEGITEQRFAALLRNYGAWHERNSDAGGPCAGLFARLELTTRPTGPLYLVVQVDAGAPDAERLMDDFVAEVGAGVGPRETTDRRLLPWLQSTGWPGLWVSNPTERAKQKSSYQRKGFSEHQIGAFHRSLSETDHRHVGFAVSIASYGGKVNTVAPDATAQPHRDSVLKLLWGTSWSEAADDERNLRWHREFYRAVHADTGGVPVPNDRTDGCFVNYADVDLGDPRWNTSGVPWSTLYFKDNYPRLQAVKARWDPRDVFRHAQSIRLPA
ncbi:FAD-binding oxidoreductase [Saccharothrix australiensis]|uniref:Aclacinomycin oxidase n=1 Tax=Saccharothrix australiensis TaxID=2072 RepID=A0A495W4Y0_9PSEU|nr:FAD-binding protein [Saccharothrix australiensis]RKT55713.1 aclacinomycin oxidase [Saccharothrix australiensis]